jgi:uncharacterized phage-like protein YoqJ
MTSTRQIFAATGHRPDKLGGYSLSVHNRLVKLAKRYLQSHRPYKAISGMALGWDQAFAQACIDLEIPFEAAIPFEGQEKRWPRDSQIYYNDLLTQAKSIHIVGTAKPEAPMYQIAKLMQERNRYMVLHCTRLIALWDGTEGGTANCIRFARANHKKCKIVNLWDKWNGS